MANEGHYIDLGLACANICKALERGMDGKMLDDLSKSVRDAINQLTMWVEPAVYTSCPSAHRAVGRGGADENHQTKRTAYNPSVSSREDRQEHNCWLEAGPQQDPCCIQRTFNAFPLGCY